jgi:hypothetical protein
MAGAVRAASGRNQNLWADSGPAAEGQGSPPNRKPMPAATAPPVKLMIPSVGAKPAGRRSRPAVAIEALRARVTAAAWTGHIPPQQQIAHVRLMPRGQQIIPWRLG